MITDPLTYSIRGAIYKTHKSLGPGLFESVYERVLQYELEKAGHSVRRQLEVPLIYDDLSFDVAFRLDLIVDDAVIIEIKSVECIANVHILQLSTYLKFTSKKIGFLVNFNCDYLKDKVSIYRIVH